MGQLEGKRTNKSVIELAYEGSMVVLAFVAVATIWYQTQYDSIIVWGTWVIFFADFLYRFFSTNQKLKFILKNPFIIIALIPLDAIFQLARSARLLHFLRLKVITKYYTRPIIYNLQKQKFIYIIPLVFLFVFVSIIPLHLLEPKLETYYDAFIGGISSLFFFGYTNIRPVTTLGVLIVTLLTILGVIMHGVILSYLFKIVGNASWIQKLGRKMKLKE